VIVLCAASKTVTEKGFKGTLLST